MRFLHWNFWQAHAECVSGAHYIWPPTLNFFCSWKKEVRSGPRNIFSCSGLREDTFIYRFPQQPPWCLNIEIWRFSWWTDGQIRPLYPLRMRTGLGYVELCYSDLMVDLCSQDSDPNTNSFHYMYMISLTLLFMIYYNVYMYCHLSPLLGAKAHEPSIQQSI